MCYYTNDSFTYMAYRWDDDDRRDEDESDLEEDSGFGEDYADD